MRSILIRCLGWGLGCGVWGVLLWESLAFAITPSQQPDAHSLCGVWGCGPPSHVLLGCHLFWLTLLVPIPLIAWIRMGGTCLRHLGQGLVGASLLLLLVMTLIDQWTWWPTSGEFQRRFLWQRIGFNILNKIEIPGLEILIWGTLLTVFSYFKRSGDNCSRGQCRIPLRTTGKPAVAEDATRNPSDASQSSKMTN